MSQFEAEVDEHFLEARLRVVKEGQIRTAADLSAWLKQLKIVAGLNREAIRAAFTTSPEVGEVFIIASGQRPSNGQAGRLDFKVAVGHKAVYEQSEEIDQIDFKSSTSFTMVSQGDLIAEVVPPKPGVDGINIKGHKIAALVGKPVEFQLGDGVTVDQTGQKIISTQFGVINFKRNILKVESVLKIDGNVDLHSGNIKFDGNVYVNGDILDGFSVEAKSLTVNGSVGASFLNISENLKIGLGINGKNKAIINVNGEIETQYINETLVQCNQSIKVKKQILNSKILCHHQVVCAQIVGGECFAFLGIISNEIGSDLGIQTQIYPGISYRVQQIDAQIRKLERSIEESLQNIKMFLGKRSYLRSLSRDKQDLIRLKIEEFFKQADLFESLRSEKEQLISSFEFIPSPEVIAYRKINKNVKIKTLRCVTVTYETIVGPLRLFEDSKRNIFRRSSKIKGGISIKKADESI
ncbi:FapA family protein [Myxococcota bacterium]|nr:FapA family protein [Myxococcota bacterium]MBU1897861.1 FapA family protein [Myxococcota bacterium]